MNIRKLSAVSLFVCLTPWMIPGMDLCAQSVQKGTVYEYQGETAKTPLPNVVIAAQNAGSVQSAADGSFSLQFRTLHAGDNIQIRRAERSGYEIMNKEAVENFRVTRQENPQPIQIVMCSHQRLQEIRNSYRNVAAKRYEKQLQASEEKLEQLRASNQLATEEYNQRMDSLEAAYEERLQNLENYIDKFARIDMTELDAVEKQIIDLVQAGNFDEAVALYDQQNFPAKLAQSQADRMKLSDARQQLAAAEAEQTKQIAKLYASIDRQFNLLCMAGGEENQMKALELRHKAYLADTTNLQAKMEYALCVNGILGNTQQAIQILENGIALAHNDYDKGRLETQIAWYYYTSVQLKI